MNGTAQAKPMAKKKEYTKEEKNARYGVPVACRVDADLAFRMSEKAEKLDISLAKYAAILIQRGEYGSATIEEIKKQHKADLLKLQKELEEEKRRHREALKKVKTISKTTIIRFMEFACNGNKRRHRELIEKYNELYDLSKSEYELK